MIEDPLPFAGEDTGLEGDENDPFPPDIDPSVAIATFSNVFAVTNTLVPLLGRGRGGLGGRGRKTVPFVQKVERHIGMV